MKRISFYAKTNRSGNLLHIETDGCIVNIQVGLHDVDGRQVTSVGILPDDYAERGGRWVQDGSRIVQLLDGETALPEPNGDNTALDQIAQLLSSGLSRDWTPGARLEAISQAVRNTSRTIPEATS